MPDYRFETSKPNWWRRIRGSRFLFISIAVHLLFAFGATVYVVQRYQAARKLTFKAGPPSPNHATRAIEHKVQLAKEKNLSKPPPALKRIVSAGLSKVTLPAMPEMPQMQSSHSKMSAVAGSGFSEGALGAPMGGAVGGAPVALFGLRQATTSSLTGTFYDLKQNLNHRSTDMNPDKYAAVVADFVRKGWNEGLLAQYYRGPQPLYTTQIFMPVIDAEEGPKAFGVQRDVKPGLWIALYKARVSPPETGTYHFVGAGDDVLFVRFDKKLVLERCYTLRPGLTKTLAEYNYHFSDEVPGGFAEGEAVNAEAGTYYDMEILIGEQPGGKFFADLLVQKVGENYEKDSGGNPILPRFRVSDVGVPNGTVPNDTVPPFSPAGPIWRAEPISH